MSHPPSRRQFLQLLGGAAGVGLLPPNFAAGCGKPALVIGSYFRPTPEAPLTPPAQFYINCNWGVPDGIPRPAEWRLRVRGLVDHPLDLALEDLLRLPQVTREVTL